MAGIAKKSFVFHLLAFCAGLIGGPAVQAAPVQAEHARVELVSEADAIVPGQVLNLALHFELEEHWHIYWKNPGASGLPVEVVWGLPEGFVAGPIQWPSPERIEMAGLINYGHEAEVTFIVPVEVPADYPQGQAVTLSAEAFWLICKEVCLPGEASLELELPSAGSASPSSHADLFEAARSSQPEASGPWTVRGAIEGNELVLDLESSGAPLPADLYFYAGSEGIVDPNAAQSVAFTGEATLRLRAPLDTPFFDRERPDRIEGVLQAESGNWQVDFPLGLDGQPKVSGGAGAVGKYMPESTGLEGALLKLGIPGWLALAFLGGLILNIMPCVLPVLSLKVFSLLKHAGQTRGQAFAHGLGYTAGVVLSFLALAGALFALRALGERIGWGFQLQSPGFVVVLTLLFFLFGLNLMGVFELGTSLVGADTKVSQRKDLAGSFGMGILAAVVGAPCMGPMVASVSGIAVQASVPTGLAIFGTMGLGLASPFLLLSIFPKLVAYLPKPGVWMETFKQLMGFLLMAAVLFLAWVAGRSGGVDAVLVLLIMMLAVGVAAWIYGRWGAPHRTKRSQRIALGSSIVLVIGSASWAVRSVGASYEASAAHSDVATEDGIWGEWSKARVEAELAAGNPVFVDFTATWCLICQVNKKVALHTSATEALFEERGIVALEADWTRYDAAITEELERYGRSGVPLYLFLTPDGGTTVLPQSLTNGIIRDAVEKALPAQ
ncbi:protein-disulfide reductase DsbD family protein [Coraliomargarita parva]|uniref:protein-disulfide reductase DsbD family protein n=1 Tax=Coraliomargarita parva TaxID=3014050 RepID=UPI0022B4CDC2|nr:protein-disulfide reductase DsbD domain-containing protein [Coraliomargarita parva]